MFRLKKQLSRRLILRFTFPVLDCFFKMFQPFFQILADDLPFKCIDPMNQDLKSAYEFSVIRLNPLQSFQHLCIGPSGCNAA